MALLTFAITIYTLAWFYNQIFNGYLFCFMDLTRYFYPYKYFLVEAIRSHSIPLWNPYIYSGFPFFATLQQGLFYPLSIIYFIMPFDHAFNWFIIIHYPLAFLFMYLMLRDFGLSKPASIVGGLSFAFSGYFNSVLHMLSSLESVIWLPLVVLFFRRALKSNYFINTVLTAAFFAIMFLGGEPTIYYGTILSLVAYIVIYNRYTFMKSISTLFSAIGLSLMFTAVQLLPFIELVMHSVRTHGLSFEEASHWSLSFRDLISLIIPYFYNLTPFPFVNTDWLKVPYLGTISILLAILAIVFSIKINKRVQALTLGFCLAIILALGKNTPLYFILYKVVPGFSMIRYPIKYIFLAVFILSILAAIGFDEILKQLSKLKNASLILGIIGIVGTVKSIFIYLDPTTFTRLIKPLFSAEISQGFINFLPGIMARNAINIGIFSLFLLLFGFAASMFAQNKIGRNFFIGFIILLVGFDMYISNKEAALSIKMSDYHRIPQNIEILMKDNDLFRVFVSPLMSVRSQTEVASEFLNYSDALYSIRNRVPVNQNMLYKIQMIDAYESIKSTDQNALIGKLNLINSFDGVRILDSMNVKYVVTPWPFFQNGYELISRQKEIIKDGYVYLYRNHNVLPRAFVVPEVMIMQRDKMLDYMASKHFEPLNEVLLEEHASLDASSMLGKANIIKYSPNEVVIKAEGPGILFLSDSYYPGWYASVDGVGSKIYRANYMFRAVILPAGEHEIVFKYNPMSFRLGLMISLLSILGAGALLFHKRNI